MNPPIIARQGAAWLDLRNSEPARSNPGDDTNTPGVRAKCLALHLPGPKNAPTCTTRLHGLHPKPLLRRLARRPAMLSQIFELQRLTSSRGAPRAYLAGGGPSCAQNWLSRVATPRARTPRPIPLPGWQLRRNPRTSRV